MGLILVGGTGALRGWEVEELRQSQGLRAENQQSWRQVTVMGLAGPRLGRRCWGPGGVRLSGRGLPSQAGILRGHRRSILSQSVYSL